MKIITTNTTTPNIEYSDKIVKGIELWKQAYIAQDNPCAYCSNRPKDGDFSVCNCTLSSPIIT